MTNVYPVRIALIGLGHVGSAFVELLASRRDAIRTAHDLDLRLVGAAELGGALVDEDIDTAQLLAHVRSSAPLAQLQGATDELDAHQVLAATRPDVLLVAVPVDHTSAEPGLTLSRSALQNGVHVVLADKGPIALAHDELTRLGDPGGTSDRPRIRFSATVGGALPVVNLGRRDLAGVRITRIEGVFNGTSQSILRAMEAGLDFDTALDDARRRGIVEQDPSLDVDGFDAAFKLLITANAVLDAKASLSDIAVKGIRDVTARELAEASARGERIVPLGVARVVEDTVELSSRPVALPVEHPLARIHPDEMGVAFYADGVDRLVATSLEPTPDPAAAAMLRDVLDIVDSTRRTRP